MLAHLPYKKQERKSFKLKGNITLYNSSHSQKKMKNVRNANNRVNREDRVNINLFTFIE